MSEPIAPASHQDWSTQPQAEEAPVTSAESDDAAAAAEIGDRFEKAWRPDQPPAHFDAYLPPPDSALRRAVLGDLCIRDLDLRFLHGLSAHVEDYLGRYPELQHDHAALIELILAEYDQRCHRAPDTDFEDYRRRFPALAEELAGRRARLPQIPGFTLEAELGRGGMGVVYRARQHDLQRTVALKMILYADTAGEEQRRRFHQEARAVAQLQHPNIIQIHQVGEHDGHPYLALEFVDGGSLEKRLDGTPWPAHTAAEFVETLARAIEHCHRHNIIHRDLKPANILLVSGRVVSGEWSRPTTDRSPLTTHQPKISDFGLAKHLDRDSGNTASGAILGTPSYMAPEQAEGQSQLVTPATDVYALGVILYELLTGRPPFKGVSRLDTLHQVRTREPVPPRQLQPKVPRDLETICLKCLRKEPLKRYATAEALADDLRCFRDDKPIQARPMPSWERGWRWCRRNPWRAGFGGLTAAIVGLLVVLLLSYLHSEQLTAVYRRGEQLTNARAAAARGAWRNALGLYEPLITGPHWPDQQHLEVERLPGFLAVNDRDRFAQEIERLAARDDLGSDAALVKLLRAEFYLCRPERQEEARRLIHEALAESGQLSDSDRAYAQALITPSSNRMTALLKDAIAQAPFHHRAHRAYLMARVLRGEFAEARQQAAFMRLHFPDDPLTDYAEALLAVLEGDRDAGLAKLAPLDQKLGPDQRAQIEQYLKKLAAALDKWNDLALGPGDVGRLRLQVQALRDLTNPGLEALAFNVPSAALLIQTLDQLAQNEVVFEQIKNPRHGPNELPALRKSSERLAAISQDSPDALFLCMRALIHLQLAVPLIDAARMPEARRELQTMRDLFQQATTAPTLLPRAPLRYQARVIALGGEACLLRAPEEEPTPAQLRRLREDCAWITAEERWPQMHSFGAMLAASLMTLDLTAEQQKEWHMDQPANRERFKARMQVLYEYGRRILMDCRQDDPKNPKPLIQLATLELKAERPEAALQAAREALTLAPSHKDALGIEQQALEALRKRDRK
jgi:serine/threonine protein kinase